MVGLHLKGLFQPKQVHEFGVVVLCLTVFGLGNQSLGR